MARTARGSQNPTYRTTSGLLVRAASVLIEPGAAVLVRVAARLPLGPAPTVPNWFEIRPRVAGEIVGRYQVLLQDRDDGQAVAKAASP